MSSGLIYDTMPFMKKEISKTHDYFEGLVTLERIRIQRQLHRSTLIELWVDEGVFNPLNLASGTVTSIDGRDTKVSEPLLEWARQKALT